jgi:hypothetical protein
MRRTAAVPALAVAGALALSGCTTSDSPKTPNSRAEVLAAARSYQRAANARDWKTACTLSTQRLRRGTVAFCVANHPDHFAAPSSSPSESKAAATSPEPPHYADGSTPEPLPSPSSSGPEYAKTGPVRATGAVKVGAAGEHRAGYGAQIAYTVTWPGKDALTVRRALRLVEQGGRWRVDQHEELRSGGVREALTDGAR